MKCMLLAAGMGNRFRPHTDKLAKPAIPFLNLPLMAYPLYYLEQLGIEKLVINTHHLPESIEEAVAQLLKKKPKLASEDEAPYLSLDKIKILHESPQILDSAGGIKNAESELQGDDEFFVANADSLFLMQNPLGLRELLFEHQKSGALVSILVCQHPGAGQEYGGVWGDDYGRVTGIGRNLNVEGQAYHNAGVYVFSSKIFELIEAGRPSHIFHDVIIPQIERGSKDIRFYYEESMLWRECGSEKDYLRATSEFLDILNSGKNKAYKSALLNILRRFNPDSKNPCLAEGAIDLNQKQNWLSFLFPNKYSSFLGENSKIEKGAKISGFVVVGREQKIPSGAQINNSVILNDIDLHANSLMQNKLIL